MAKSMVDFLEELDVNSELRDHYQKDPVGTASDYGLSKEDVKTIEKQDWDKVRQMFDDVNKSPRIFSY